MRTAGSLRQSSKPDARARVKGSRANVSTRRVGCVARASHPQGTGRIRATGNDGSSFGHWRGVCRHEADFELGLQIGGPNNYVPIEATPSWPVLLFTLGVSVLTGV